MCDSHPYVNYTNSHSSHNQVLDASGEAALQTFFQSGGVYTGVHSASTCLTDDANYGLALGGKSMP